MTETHPAAYPASYSLEPKPRRKVKRKRDIIRRHRQCDTPCCGARDCVLNANSPHEWHICDDPKCTCHSEHKGKVVR